MSQPSCGNLQDDMPKDERRALASALVSLLDPRWLPGSLGYALCQLVTVADGAYIELRMNGRLPFARQRKSYQIWCWRMVFSHGDNVLTEQY
jgi:hypothetical protein